jgi:hypothetical protein
MKKLFLYACLSLFAVSNFSEALAAMNPAKKRRIDSSQEIVEPGAEEHKDAEEDNDDDWDLKKTIEDEEIFEQETDRTYLGNRFKFEYKGLNEDSVNHIQVIYFGTFDNKNFTIVFTLLKNKTDVSCAWTCSTVIDVQNNRALNTSWGSGYLPNCTAENAWNFNNFYLSSFVGIYLTTKKILNQECSVCPNRLAYEMPTGEIHVLPRYYLSCGHVLCEECYKQWEKRPHNKCLCPADWCIALLDTEEDCLRAGEMTMHANAQSPID